MRVSLLIYNMQRKASEKSLNGWVRPIETQTSLRLKVLAHLI